VTKLAETFPVCLRHVVEVKQGVSNARNRGIAEARGKILAFTDDDVRPAPTWIHAVLSTVQKFGCDAVIGKIELQWTFTRPKWLTDDLTEFLARLDYGEHEFEITSQATPPYGPNMAFKKEIFDSIGEFDPTLGRRLGSLATGEEPDLFSRFLAAGFKAIYQPESLVYHELQPGRVKKSFFRKSHFFNGVNAGKRYNANDCKRVLGIPLFLFRQLCRSIGIFVKDTWYLGVDNSLRKEVNAWYLFGFMVGCAKSRWQGTHRFQV